ncbi:MAG: aminotransferase class III-fold pyridoxal phosphate-dependent enzyme [Exilibacterium sp.]
MFRQKINVVTIDAFSPGAVESLTAEIRTGEVALIWFEYIQGQTGKRLPGELIEVIKKSQKIQGYYIGVDEILMGMYRSGTFFSYAGTGLSPDIVTLSKGLSYMSFPTGATLVNSRVYESALETCSKTVQWLQSRYINSLGAHIALHCLNRLEREDIGANVESSSAALQAGLDALIARGGLIEKAETTGLMMHLSYRTPWWIRMLGKSGRMAYLLLLTRFWLKQDVFVFLDSRIAPSLCLSADEVDTFLQKAERIAATTPLKIVLDGILKK